MQTAYTQTLKWGIHEPSFNNVKRRVSKFKQDLEKMKAGSGLVTPLKSMQKELKASDRETTVFIKSQKLMEKQLKLTDIEASKFKAKVSDLGDQYKKGKLSLQQYNHELSRTGRYYTSLSVAANKAEKDMERTRIRRVQSLKAGGMGLAGGIGLVGAGVGFTGYGMLTSSIQRAQQLSSDFSRSGLSPTQIQDFQNLRASNVTLDVGSILQDIQERTGEYLRSGKGEGAEILNELIKLNKVTKSELENMNPLNVLMMLDKHLRDSGRSDAQRRSFLEDYASDSSRINFTQFRQTQAIRERFGLNLNQEQMNKLNTAQFNATQLDSGWGRLQDSFLIGFTDSASTAKLLGLMQELQPVAEGLGKFTSDFASGLLDFVKSVSNVIKEWNISGTTVAQITGVTASLWGISKIFSPIKSIVKGALELAKFTGITTATSAIGGGASAAGAMSAARNAAMIGSRAILPIATITALANLPKYEQSSLSKSGSQMSVIHTPPPNVKVEVNNTFDQNGFHTEIKQISQDTLNDEMVKAMTQVWQQ
ncbi:hypothetical protein P0J00_003459 [Vibrio vulnificus]|nr:hypothetical protein [Vibrio vulnificus]EKO5193457.1 hypothetical protein [Vibrio vulnificus]